MALDRRGILKGVATLGVLAGARAALAAEDPAPASPPPAKAAMVDVIVLGGGVAGLNAAWLLEQQGMKVLVLEGRKRVGGRVLTLMDQPGRPEMGFNSMGAGYGRGIDAAKRAGVTLVDNAPRFMKDPRQLLVVGGTVIPREAWAESPLNPLPPAYRAMMPWEVVPAVFGKHNPLANWSAWSAPSSAKLDVSVHEVLAGQGLSDAAIRLVFDAAPYYGTSAYDAAALTYEFNDGWLKSQSLAGHASLAVKGGNQLLPLGMASLLRGDVLLGREVVAIATDADSATITCLDGTTHRSRRAVCALPFSTLRSIRITPGLAGAQAQAVMTLPYQKLSIAFLTVRAPFWEKDGLPASVWTDGPLGQMLALRGAESTDEVTGLAAYARGTLAQYWDRLGKEGVLRLLVAELERLRPASKGLVTGATYHSWAQEPFNAGDWAYFAPGQITAFAREMAAPSGRLHFCGEHTARANRGIEGALESSERVALEVISA